MKYQLELENEKKIQREIAQHKKVLFFLYFF